MQLLKFGLLCDICPFGFGLCAIIKTFFRKVQGMKWVRDK